MLKLESITHAFDIELYKDLNLDVKAQESVAILGVSGSGKSTILNHASSFLKPLKGSVKIDEVDIYSLKSDKLASLRKQTLGVIFQSHYLFRGFSAYENLKVASILGDKEIDSKMLESFGIEHVLKQQIGTLSGGQQQRLSIARVLTKMPRVLIADEPTGNLDSKTARDVMNHLFNYIKANDACMLLATHDTELARLCDKTYMLKDCKLERI
ncbi:ATP-binding cassette domain-containing protein [Helicobacter sp. 11S02629-2]|uniref:ATP-binding cassette domain-containing protein n=1 Tax=Helicobacter sp. 11S02629-2 TaxID=1476195 RepID=UPI000BA4F2F7|nr:ATP-binding cassette domain-containing protein [Helicobacter sp. 11S02629-2]PAF45991.1 ABC transporter ATP-binding protein [Helicobacter sp. 11S02629-2]